MLYTGCVCLFVFHQSSEGILAGDNSLRIELENIVEGTSEGKKDLVRLSQERQFFHLYPEPFPFQELRPVEFLKLLRWIVLSSYGTKEWSGEKN